MYHHIIKVENKVLSVWEVRTSKKNKTKTKLLLSKKCKNVNPWAVGIKYCTEVLRSKCIEFSL